MMIFNSLECCRGDRLDEYGYVPVMETESKRSDNIRYVRLVRPLMAVK